MQKLYGKLVTVWSALVLIIVAMAVLAEEVDSAAMFDQNSAHFKAQQKSCSNLCGFCPSCNGFYCGEECICECRQEATEHVQCINKIRENSDKLGLIYDVLIQLPKSTTRFARSAGGKHLDPSEEATFRKVMELAQLPVWLTKVPLQARIHFGGASPGLGKRARSPLGQRRHRTMGESRASRWS
ncbi:uncharacterized protein LOC6045673 isoform X2 [Culex quinquefasciatus]|uniref:uncharacterized protein LOC6045673 isoform X2 n=1 Tax=Culex quinquefasciatus TaxID=7176 RepID=UPI0018E2A730|nr:uncharacterized protein LOC6045673 isoform X2 [Culex quinquefasciatus]